MSLKSDLAHFTGSETFYEHPLIKNHVYTEGVQYLAEKTGAYWLIDAVVFNQLEGLRKHEFQVWDLDVKDCAASLTCTDGNDNKLHEQLIEFTDFPEPGIRLYLINGTLLLPSEY